MGSSSSSNSTSHPPSTLSLSSLSTSEGQSPPPRQEESYLSLGKFSFSSFANRFTGTSSESVDVQEDDPMDISVRDEQSPQDNSGERNEEEIQEANENEVHPVSFESRVEEHEAREEAVNQCSDIQDEKEYSKSRSLEKINLEPKGDDGFCVPVGEPKRVKFATPKLLKVPLKLSSPNTKHSPKPQITSPEPRLTVSPELPEQPIFETVAYHGEDASWQQEQQQTHLTPIIEESDGQVQSQRDSQKRAPNRSDQLQFQFPPPSDSERRATSRFMRENPELPLADDSCEVLVEKNINVEKLLEIATTLYQEVEEKIDDSFVELLDHRYR